MTIILDAEELERVIFLVSFLHFAWTQLRG